MPAPENPSSEQPRPFTPERPLVIGLVGGVASGKSTVAAMIEAHGLRHIDADAHARRAAEAPDVLAQVRTELGERFVVDGRLDRAALAERVFDDPEAKAALEAILHPRVRSQIRSDLDEARRLGRSSLLDVPLLFEAGLWERCDQIVFVEAADATRRAAGRTASSTAANATSWPWTRNEQDPTTSYLTTAPSTRRDASSPNTSFASRVCRRRRERPSRGASPSPRRPPPAP